MPPVREQILKRKNKQPERPFTPSAQQFEKAFNIISNIDSYNMPAFKNMVETSSVAELQDMLSVFSWVGSTTIIEKLKRISEITNELQTLTGLRNVLTDAIAKLQEKFIDNVSNEYPNKHGLVNARKIKEDIKIQLGIRAALTSSMIDN